MTLEQNKRVDTTDIQAGLTKKLAFSQLQAAGISLFYLQQTYIGKVD